MILERRGKAMAAVVPSDDLKLLLHPPPNGKSENWKLRSDGGYWPGSKPLQRNPRPVGVEKLSDSENLYCVRVGPFRIIYEIEDRITRVLVLKVGDRKEVYKR